MNYYEHHLGDYIRDTAHLSLAEDGAYRRLLDVYYAREQPFSICEKSIFRLVRANNRHEQLAVLAVLREFFVKDGDCYRNHRCDKEIARFREKSAKAKASANARWDKSERNANALPTQCEGNAPSNQSPVTSNQEEKIRGDSAAADAARSPPKKASRAKARTTFPPDFALTDSDRAYALERCPDMNVPATFEDFRNHHTAKGTLGADWHAGWRTWIGNCQKDSSMSEPFARPQWPSSQNRSARPNGAADRQPPAHDALSQGWWIARAELMQQIFPRGLCEQSQTALDLACFNGDQARPGYAEARAAYLAAAQAEIDRRAGR